jgi:hypothetical protein
MKGQIEIHWTTEDGKGGYNKHQEVLDPGKDAQANRRFEELKDSPTAKIFDLRLLKVERWCSMS